MRKKVAIIIICVLIIILFFLYFNYSKKFNIQEDFIFFKLFQNYPQMVENENKIKATNNLYVFNVNYQQLKFKEVKLLDTIDKNFLVRGKVAPGTRGNFNIFITSNEDSKYQIKFKSENEKPKNLKFCYSNKKCERLEELEKYLNGNINKLEEKTIQIDWIWEYESGEDSIDTYDGKNIENYQFKIGVVGKPM